MKNQTPSIIARFCQALLQSTASRIICSAIVFFVSLHNTFAQMDAAAKSKVVWEDEGIYRKQLKNDSIPADVIEKLVESRKELMLQERNVVPVRQPLKLFGQNPVTQAGCPGMGVETGWGVWTATTGDFASSGIITYGVSSAPAAPRFNLTSGTGIDACTPNGGGPSVPVVAPGFGNSSIQIGQIQTNGATGSCSSGCVEKLTYPLTVTANDSNFTFGYAIVIEDPNHSVTQQPFVSLCIYDSNGNSIGPCGCFKYTAGPGLPGFFMSSCNVNSVSYYKPWTLVGVNLSAYVGQTLTIEIINADCAQGGHFAQSYWDFSCGVMQFSGGCVGTQSTICAPNGLGYSSYLWSTGATTSCIVVTPNPGDTFSLQVGQPSGCNFYILYVPVSTNVQALFSYLQNGNVVTFTNLSTGTSAYAWDFGDGNSSTQQNPVYTYTAIGTYTVCLVAGIPGCSDTICNIITVASVTAANENELLSSIFVFPNPSSGNLFVHFGTKNFGTAEISFIDIIGQTLFETIISANGKQALDVSKFSEGIYFLQLKTDYGITTKKIVIAK